MAIDTAIRCTHRGPPGILATTASLADNVTPVPIPRKIGTRVPVDPVPAAVPPPRCRRRSFES